MLRKPLAELGYERTVSIGVTYAGEAVGFESCCLGSGLCPCWNQGSSLADMTL